MTSRCDANLIIHSGEPTPQISINISGETAAVLEALAAKHKTTTTSIVRRAICYFAGAEDRWAAPRIDQLRRCVHLHSLIYYWLSDNIITDAGYDQLSQELVALQAEHPGVGTYLPEVFADWSGDTGMHLPHEPHHLAWAARHLARARRPQHPWLSDTHQGDPDNGSPYDIQEKQ